VGDCDSKLSADHAEFYRWRQAHRSGGELALRPESGQLWILSYCRTLGARQASLPEGAERLHTGRQGPATPNRCSQAARQNEQRGILKGSERFERGS
jgi:hypothetical protein